MPATPAIAEARSESRPAATSNEAVTSEFVRLIRKGNRVSAYRSLNGVSWTLVGSEEVPMASTIHAGLVVTTQTAGELATATFENVQVTAGDVSLPVSARRPRPRRLHR